MPRELPGVGSIRPLLNIAAPRNALNQAVSKSYVRSQRYSPVFDKDLSPDWCFTNAVPELRWIMATTLGRGLQRPLRFMPLAITFAASEAAATMWP